MAKKKYAGYKREVPENVKVISIENMSSSTAIQGKFLMMHRDMATGLHRKPMPHSTGKRKLLKNTLKWNGKRMLSVNGARNTNLL